MRPIIADSRRLVRGSTLPLVVLAIIAGLWGCDGNNKITNPAFEPEITNVADNFQLQATDVRNMNQIVEYTWQNTGTAANVDQSCAITQGTATIRLFDNAGTEVYSKSLTEGGSYVTTAGTAGSWRIRLTFTRTYGTINFRVQKNT